MNKKNKSDLNVAACRLVRHKSSYRKYELGSALLLVIVITGLLAATIAALMSHMQSSADVTSQMIQRRKAFYATDGMMRSALSEAGTFLRANPAATSADLDAYLDAARLDSITPTGYTRAAWSIGTNVVGPGVVPNGPFEGMNARKIPIDMNLTLTKNNGEVSSSAMSSVVLAQIGAFQFFIFVDGNYANFDPYPPTWVTGRSHVNGDFCVGGNHGITFERITAAGRLLHSSDSICRNRGTRCGSDHCETYIMDETNCPDGFIPDLPAYTRPHHYSCDMPELKNNNDHNGGHATPTWKEYAKARWGEAAQDVDHGVPILRVPIVGSPVVNAGINAKVASGSVNSAKESNLNNSRFLVDPVRSADPVDVRKQKFMYKADIRIIDGIWFLRDMANPEKVGTPIWSDHPGHYNYNAPAHGLIGSSTIAAGQEDLFPGNAARPHMYSYYEADSTGQLSSDQMGVISYGTLYKQTIGAETLWRPGFRMIDHVNEITHPHITPPFVTYTYEDKSHWVQGSIPGDLAHTFNEQGSTNNGGSNTYGDVVLVDAAVGSMSSRLCSDMHDSSQCDSDTADVFNVSYQAGIINSTRFGIDLWQYSETLVRSGREGPNAPSSKANILPINFDMATFQAALNNMNPGELGKVLSDDGRVFNGIVYITSTWPNWDANMSDVSDNVMTTPPENGNRIYAGNFNVDIDGSSRHIGQQALPYALCSDDLGGTSQYFSSKNRFLVPQCNGNGTHQVSTPSAVRLINGKYLNPLSPVNYAGMGFAASLHPNIPAQMLTSSGGISMVTNLPGYIVGDYNVNAQNTNLRDPPSDDRSTGKWTPSLFASDFTGLNSNTMDDANSRWDLNYLVNGEYKLNRNPSDVKWNTCILTGWAVSRDNNNGAGLQRTMLQQERFNDRKTFTFRGSILVGYASTVAQFRVRGNNAVGAPTRDWGYDFHYDSLSNQPPGAPEYTVSAVRSWTRN